MLMLLSLLDYPGQCKSKSKVQKQVSCMSICICKLLEAKKLPRVQIWSCDICCVGVMKLVEVTFPRRKSERNSTLTVLMLVEMCTLWKQAQEVAVEVFGGKVVSALAFHLWGHRFKPQWELLNVTRTQSSCEKSKSSTLCRKSWVFSGYSGFLPQGKLTGWVRHIQ
jgi:hypothetical protein